jgi:hypothetical protein
MTTQHTAVTTLPMQVPPFQVTGGHQPFITPDASTAVQTHAISSVRTVERRVSTSDVRDLIDAAGPLTLRDIAGGLDVPERRAARVVATMTKGDRLQQDEWGRWRNRAA